jgi:hypothetical protein
VGGEIGLELDPAEAAMLGVIEEGQLAGIIKQTVVPMEQRRVFMGTVAAAMLAVIGVGLVGCGKSDATGTGASGGEAPKPWSTTAPSSFDVAGFIVTSPPATATQPAMPATNPVGTSDFRVPIDGMRIDRPPETSTPTAPETGTAPATLPANAPMIIRGLRADVPPAIETPAAPATGDEVLTVGLRAIRPPETSTQPAATASGAPETKPAETAPAPASTRRGYGTMPGGGGFGGAGPARN